MKYLIRDNEEKAVCLVCKKTFIRKKGSKTKTCSKKCANRLASKTKKTKGINVFKYTDYCTCFYIDKYKEIWFWDEITDKRINKMKVDNLNDAIKIMEQYKANAPKNCICEVLEF